MNAQIVAAALDHLGIVTYEHTGGGIGTIYLQTLRVPAAFAVGPFHYREGTPCDDALYVGFDQSDEYDTCTKSFEVVAAIVRRLV